MRQIALAFPLLALAACGSDPEPAPTPTPTQTAAGPRTLVAAGFNDQQLGPRIVGPQGDEVSDTVMFEGRQIADVVSYVACPAPTVSEGGNATAPNGTEAECDPAEQGEDAVFTYVHRVTPGEGADGPLLSFRTSRRAHGFANLVGFDRVQAQAALGEDYDIGVQLDNGQLIWRIKAGDGWTAGEEITFFWQSTLPPEGPAEAYEIETEEGRMRVSGPFPPTMPRPEGTENLPGG